MEQEAFQPPVSRPMPELVAHSLASCLNSATLSFPQQIPYFLDVMFMHDQLRGYKPTCALYTAILGFVLRARDHRWAKEVIHAVLQIQDQQDREDNTHKPRGGPKVVKKPRSDFVVDRLQQANETAYDMYTRLGIDPYLMEFSEEMDTRLEPRERLTGLITAAINAVSRGTSCVLKPEVFVIFPSSKTTLWKLIKENANVIDLQTTINKEDDEDEKYSFELESLSMDEEKKVTVSKQIEVFSATQLYIMAKQESETLRKNTRLLVHYITKVIDKTAQVASWTNTSSPAYVDGKLIRERCRNALKVCLQRVIAQQASGSLDQETYYDFRTLIDFAQATKDNTNIIVNMLSKFCKPDLEDPMFLLIVTNISNHEFLLSLCKRVLIEYFRVDDTLLQKQLIDQNPSWSVYFNIYTKLQPKDKSMRQTACNIATYLFLLLKITDGLNAVDSIELRNNFLNIHDIAKFVDILLASAKSSTIQPDDPYIIHAEIHAMTLLATLGVQSNLF